MKKPSEIRVLVVDDNQELADSITSLFKLFKFSITTVYGGEAAWARIQSGEEFDVVLTDIRMPVLDGVELLRRIRSRDPVRPCVMMISGFNDYLIETLYDLGANGFFAKPFGAQSVRDAIQRAMVPARDRWAISGLLPSENQVTRTFKSLEDMNQSGEIRWGGGGFFIHAGGTKLSAGSLIRFDLTVTAQPGITKIEGNAIVRWARPVAQPGLSPGVGAEITFLSDACREPIAAWLGHKQFLSFIPQS